MIDINTGETLKGVFSTRISFVEEWRRLHKEELMQDWELARQPLE